MCRKMRVFYRDRKQREKLFFVRVETLWSALAFEVVFSKIYTVQTRVRLKCLLALITFRATYTSILTMITELTN